MLKFSKKYNLDRLYDSQNINEFLNEKDSELVGRTVIETYRADRQSRSGWEKNIKEAMELALQIKKKKMYPWPNASNVKFPLVTIAALQFLSRVYTALIKAPDLVKYKVQGNDEDGKKAARASRISRHMSYQLLEEDEAWEEQQDKAFLVLPILGCVFKKSYFDPTKGHNCSKTVLPKNLVVHYFAKSIEDCERKTEVLELFPRQIKERQLRKIFTEIKDLPAPSLLTEFDDLHEDEDERQGTRPDASDDSLESRPRKILEQHTYFDLDGDGYKEPYVATVDLDTGKVFRLVHRFKEVVTEQSLEIEETQKRIRALAEGVTPPEGEPSPEQMAQLQRVRVTVETLNQRIKTLAGEKPKILKIVPLEHYTKYTFIPSPDGGFYDLGFGTLLGPLNDSVNTLINQLIDAGTLNNSNSGFLGKGARIKGGKLTFSINEWKRVDVAGGTLKDNIIPLPTSEPSAVLFSLLSLLIQYTERTSSVTETMSGENPGQNTPAYNMQAMLEQGLQIFNGIFKRVYRGFRSELRKLYYLNSVYLDNEDYFEYQDSRDPIFRVDYTADPKDLIPAADPNAFSSREKVDKAVLIAERAQGVPGYNPIAVEKRFLEAMDIPDVNEVFPLQQNPETGQLDYVFPPQPDPELELEKAELQRKTLESQSKHELDSQRAASEMMVNEAKVMQLIAQAAKDFDEIERNRLEMQLKDMISMREALVETAKIEASERESERTANQGVGGESGNTSS